MNTTLPTKLLAFVLSLMLPAVAAAQTSAAADDYNSRGLAKEAKGDHDGAIAEYNRAIELAAKLAIFCMDGTIADYNRAIELDPKQPRAYINRGFAKQAKSDVDGATVDYNRALELAAKLAKP
jgi:tetratricopeptide (TPR) repeat protein